MLTRFKANGDFIYINPDRVFAVKKWDDERTTIQLDDNTTAVVDGLLDQVAMQLNDAMGR